MSATTASSAPAAAAEAPASTASGSTGDLKKDESSEQSIRSSNIVAGRAIADTLRTSLGPRGMDKMITSPSGDVTITNDGATILEQLQLQHPAAKIMAELGKSQDIEAGDGTTTVVVLAGAMLNAVSLLMARGVHPTLIADSFMECCVKAQEVLKSISVPVDLADRDSLIKSATTSLNSKLVSQNSALLAPIAVDAVLKVAKNLRTTAGDDSHAVTGNVDLRDVRVTKSVGGTIDDTQLVDGIVFSQAAAHNAGGPTRIENAKIGLIQFCLSPPKTNMDNQVIVSDYTQMDRVVREERKYIRKICTQIKKTGCNVLLIQKSILRDAVTDVALHFLARLKILVVRDVERTDIEFISRSCGCTPIASIESFTADRLGTAKLVQEESTSGDGSGKIVKITGVPNPGHTVSVLIRGANNLIVDEAERSLHDALCVVRSLVKVRYLCPGGGAPETEIALRVREWAKTLTGVKQLCARQYAEAFEIIPYTLAENAGLNPMQIVTELKAAHVAGQHNAGIDMRKATHAQGKISDMFEKNVIAPLLVFSSAIQLATETVVMLLKIDNIVETR